MRKFIRLFTLTALMACPFISSAQEKYRWSDELELLKRIDLLPQYRTDSYVESFSSYDRTFGNDDGFSGLYSFIRKENDKLVIAEMEGPGVIDRIWTPTPNETMLYFYFDGEEEPGLKIKFMDLFSGEVYPFLKPICGNEVGGYFCYLPITYRKSCKIVYDGPLLYFIQIGYRNLPGKDVETFSHQFTEADRQIVSDVCDVLGSQNPSVSLFDQGKSANVKTLEKEITLIPGKTENIFDYMNPGRIVGIQLDGGSSIEGMYKDLILTARWDKEASYAINAPVQDFFGYAFGKGAMRGVYMGKQGYDHYCYLPMPFDKSATLDLIYEKREGYQPTINAKVTIHYTTEGRAADEGKFYSVWKREETPLGSFHTFLKAQGKGHYVGTILQSQGLVPGTTFFFEGDDSTYVDGKMRLHGTGSEDYFNGGWYAILDRWDRGVSLPLHGSLDYSLPMGRTGGYRFHITDKMSYEKEIYHGMEHGGENNDFPVDYVSVALYYSDTPPVNGLEPKGDLLKVYEPSSFVYLAESFHMTIDGDMNIVRKNGIEMTTQGEGRLQLKLYDVPEGRYKLKMDYATYPEGGEFQVWQRQKRLTDWIHAKSEKEEEKKEVELGELYLTHQTNSITIHFRKSDEKGKLDVRRIILEKVE